MALKLLSCIPALSLTSCMTLNELLSPPEPWFLYQCMKKEKYDYLIHGSIVRIR